MQEQHHNRKKRTGAEAEDENQAFVILSKNTLDKAKREINQATSRVQVNDNKSRTPGDRSLHEEIDGLSPMSNESHRLNGVMGGNFAQES